MDIYKSIEAFTLASMTTPFNKKDLSKSSVLDAVSKDNM